MKNATKPVMVFYSYAHEDEVLRDELEKHLTLLQRQGRITSWYDRKILAGEECAGKIDQQLEEASLILLLISPDFLASTYCYEIEMQRALERHRQGTARVIPIILRPVYWSGAPFAHLQCLPRDGTPVTERANRDAAFFEITEGICSIIEQQDVVVLPLPSPNRHNRKRVLKRVRSIWIEGILEHSLHQAMLIKVGLHEEPCAVANPWKLDVQETNFPARLLPPETHVTSIYDAADGELLILGAPGAGKTTLLLELTRDLLKRAEENEHEPIPVVFQLSSWATKREPLVSWLIEELQHKYMIPRFIAEQWVTMDQLIPLLDGLDEVVIEQRQTCLDEINAYHQNHPLHPLVVCSRRSEYNVLATPLTMQRAIMLQPLTIQQVETYFAQLGESVVSLWYILSINKELQEVVTTPLMLNILTLTYHDRSVQDLADKRSVDVLQQHIFERYVERMLARRGTSVRYSHEQTLYWVTWLAKQMKQKNLTALYLERMDVNWLPTKRWRWINDIMTALPDSLPAGLLIGLAFGLPFGLLVLPFGLLTGFPKKVLSETTHWTWNRIKKWKYHILLIGLLVGLLIGLLDGLLIGLLIGLLSILLGMLLNGLSKGQVDPQFLLTPNAGIRLSIRNELFTGLFFGLPYGLLIGLLVGHSIGPFVGLLDGLLYGLLIGLFSAAAPYFQQKFLMLLLYHLGFIPKDFIPFLEYATERILLRRVGGGYMFVHSLLMDYFASLASPSAPVEEEKPTAPTNTST